MIILEVLVKYDLKCLLKLIIYSKLFIIFINIWIYFLNWIGYVSVCIFNKSEINLNKIINIRYNNMY